MTTKAVYDVCEVAAMLGIGRNQTYEAIHRGEIPSIRIGKRIKVPRAAFDRLLNKDQQGAAA